MDFLFSLDTWISLVTLTFLEIVLGVDNLVFISLLSHRVPKPLQKRARRIGLFFAIFTRLLFLGCVSALSHLSQPLFTLNTHPFSPRDLLLLGGGIFLLFKGSQEIHNSLSPAAQSHHATPPLQEIGLMYAVVQMILFDIIFSIDSVFTAVGMTQHYPIMAASLVIAAFMMVFAADLASNLIEKHLSLKILALGFLLLVGMVLVADGLGFHIPRGYVYFAILFSLFIEILNILSQSRN